MTAKILVLDIETTRAEVGTFSLYRPYISIDQVRVPPRILCYAAKWRDSDKTLFKAAWKDGDEVAYQRMMDYAYNLMEEADFVVTWNGERFDLQWLEAEFARLDMGRPAPYRSVDLMRVAKKNFGKGLPSLKLDWSARHWLKDQKVTHEGLDLWDDIRYGNREERRYAQKLMRQYNEHDVELTARLFERYLPWIGENFALYDDNADDGVLRCKCGSENVQRRGYFPTKAYMYQRFWCKDCRSWNKGRRMVYTNELRPV